jgi:hypothetical protein
MAIQAGSAHRSGSRCSTEALVAGLLELNLTQELAVFCDDEQEDVGAMDCVVIGKVLSPASVHVSTIRSAMRLAGAIRPKCNETSRGNLFGLNIIVVGEKAENLFIADLLARISLSNHNTSRKAPLLTPFGANSTQRQLSRHLLTPVRPVAGRIPAVDL